MKRSKAEVRDELLNIDTGFKDENGKKIRVDSFASFLDTEEKFPSNKTIRNHFNVKEYDPDKKKNKTESDNAENQLKSNDIKRELFPSKGNKLKESFSLPNDFFDDKDFNNDYMFVGLNAAFRSGKKNYSNWKNFHDTSLSANTYKLYIQINADKGINPDDRFRGCYITDIIKSVIDSNSGHVMRNLFITGNEDISFFNHPESTPVLDAKRVGKLALFQCQDEKTLVNDMLDRMTDDYKKGKRGYSEKRYQLKEVKKLDDEELKTLSEDNRENLDKSLDIFISECLAIRPKQLVVFGGSASTIIDKMVKSQYLKDKLHNIYRTTNLPTDFDVLDLLSNRKCEVTHYSKRMNFEDWFNTKPQELSDSLKELKEKELSD
ncbi:hypothetical protein [Companilactobacillus nantensis]|uniref:Uncharacterized protein n=1 Tax=Companilactobacillus nantensis DSM 16982 TaxID=1423774 RepID=A0A0R1WJA3_9LACO|nr:hypothetical protein [Companilactobacillus nantensis]KRM17950.1 hypothetical protein FD31_GL002118 [Companilactobacillus nantensis DSM 16982]GEO63613.1 hypothetical protein LNA01_07960 [Companilactobacillus nantensis]